MAMRTSFSFSRIGRLALALKEKLALRRLQWLSDLAMPNDS
jgi:hypothetical protein